MNPVFEEPDRFGGEGDAVYAGLVAAHESLSEAESAALNARLILLLAHLVGDPQRIAEAVAMARASVRPTDTAALQASPLE